MEEAAPAQPKRTLPRWLIPAVVGLLLIALVAWWLNGRNEAVRRSALGRVVDAVSPGFVEPMLQRDPAKMQRLAEEVVRAARFDRLVVTDRSGKVLATTDTRNRDRTLPELAKDHPSALIRGRGPRVLVLRGVYVAPGNRIGSLLVESRL